MDVILTLNAEDNLWQIYKYHSAYSEDYAVNFQTDITRYLISTLSRHPELGRLYNESKGIRRLVYETRYNVYYTVGETVNVIFILDGRLQLNLGLVSSDLDFPTN